MPWFVFSVLAKIKNQNPQNQVWWLCGSQCKWADLSRLRLLLGDSLLSRVGIRTFIAQVILLHELHTFKESLNIFTAEL